MLQQYQQYATNTQQQQQILQQQTLLSTPNNNTVNSVDTKANLICLRYTFTEQIVKEVILASNGNHNLVSNSNNNGGGAGCGNNISGLSKSAQNLTSSSRISSGSVLQGNTFAVAPAKVIVNNNKIASAVGTSSKVPVNKKLPAGFAWPDNNCNGRKAVSLSFIFGHSFII